MTHSTNAELFEYLKGIMHASVTRDRRTNYTKQAKLLWAGKHYLLVKTGPVEGVSEVEVWSREALLLKRGNPTKNAMVEIALAAIDPIHKRWGANFRKVLWTSRSGGIVGGACDSRWSKTTKTLLVHWVKRALEETFDYRLAQFQDTADEINKFSQDMAAIFNDGRRRTMGTIARDGVPYPAGCTYHVMLPGDPGQRARFRFRPSTTNNRVTVHWNDVDLDRKEFEILAEAVLKIVKNREAALGQESTQEVTHDRDED